MAAVKVDAMVTRQGTERHERLTRSRARAIASLARRLADEVAERADRGSRRRKGFPFSFLRCPNRTGMQTGTARAG